MVQKGSWQTAAGLGRWGHCPVLSVHRLITCDHIIIAIALGKAWAQHCVHALGKPRDVVSVSRTRWDRVDLCGWECWLGRTSPPGRCQEGGKHDRQPLGLSLKMGLIKVSYSRRCGWSCIRGKAGKSHFPIQALVPCGATLMRWKSGGAKRHLCVTTAGWGHISLVLPAGIETLFLTRASRGC